MDRDKIVETITGLGQNASPFWTNETSREFLSALEAVGLVIVASEPSDALLASMALRSDHGIFAPGAILSIGGGKLAMPTDSDYAERRKNRIESTIAKMRQIHEEVVGTGFYSEERAGHYSAMISAALGEKGSDNA